MDAETWISANRAIELGFADGLLLRESGAQNMDRPSEMTATMNSFVYSRSAVTNSLLDKLRGRPPDQPKKREQPKTPIADLDKRLALLL